MKLTVHTFISLDGTMQGPGGPDEDRRGGFDQGGWVAPLFDDTLGAAMGGWFGQADAFLLGRRTYEIFSAYWPHVTDPADEVARLLNTLPKHVASRTPGDLAWDGARRIDGDVVEAIRALKAQPGRELQVHGSGDLIQTLLAHDLVDELRVITFPVLVGSGARLFAGGTKPAALTLASSETTTTGAIIGVYRTPGSLVQGNHGIVDGRDTVIDDGSGAPAIAADITAGNAIKS